MPNFFLGADADLEAVIRKLLLCLPSFDADTDN